MASHIFMICKIMRRFVMLKLKVLKNIKMNRRVKSLIVRCISLLAVMVVMTAFTSCDDTLPSTGVSLLGEPIRITGCLSQENVTRANEQGFVTGDRMGIYIVDYVNGVPGVIDAKNNRASNVLYTFNGDTYRWSSPSQIYWKDNNTSIDLYGYYPGENYIGNPSEYDFVVSDLQNQIPVEGEMSDYEASDFLWGKVTDVSPTEEEIRINYSHRMAGVWVTLVAGEGFSQTEWEKLPKTVQVDNTIRTAVIDIADGVPQAQGNVDGSIFMLQQGENGYRAVVVPQTVSAGKDILGITIDGITYRHRISSDMVYESGKMHNFTVTVKKSDIAGDYTLNVVYDGITAWTNDEISHAFSTNAYVIVECPETGMLKESITNAGYDYKEMQNLKVTGKLNTTDFNFINKEMVSLKHLNLRDTKVWAYHSSWPDGSKEWYVEDELPGGAFKDNKCIRSVTLPTSLKRIGPEGFYGSNLMYSTLEVPEGVTFLGHDLFSYTDYNGMTLILPNSLDTIEGSVLTKCQWECELNLSDKIKYIGGGIYYGCSSPRFRGVFHVPSGLKSLPASIFAGLGSNGSFTGTIEIPQGITEIGEAAFGVSLKNRVDLTVPQGVKKIGHIAFMGMRFSSLKFNDDLEIIEKSAFEGASIPFQIELPKNLMKLDVQAFWNCGIEGEVIIPENCLDIGSNALRGNSITKITLPDKLEFIQNEAFQSLGYITEITIPKYVDWIGERAFADNGYLQTVISLNPEPPVLGKDAFAGVYMDKVVLQVPENSIEQYRNAVGWKEFKNITAYRELAFNVPDIVCMNKGAVRQGIVRSEGEWEIVECPSWIKVSSMEGKYKKEELTVTVEEQAAGSATREGKIVFRLKEKGYTTYTTVRQVGSSNICEDETIVLQEATAGADKAIPLFIVGDGYNADEIASGKYLTEVKEQMEHFFSIEPMKSYRDYFTVSTAFAVSPESGISGLTRFETNDFNGNNNMVREYARKYAVGVNGNEGSSTIIVLLNTDRTSNRTELYANGLSISYIGKSADIYPFNQQGFVLHEVVGKGFGKLAVESVNHFTFIKSCGCNNCNMMNQYYEYKARGWWQNVSVSSRINELPWKHLVFDERYAQYVDVHEGALNHSRGAYRSENASVMGNLFIPYFNTISREILVRRIMECAGETFSFQDFVAKDKIELPEE